MLSAQRQKGLTVAGWLFVIVLVGSLATLSVRLIPHYIDFSTIITLFESLPASDVHTMTKGQIREALDKRFSINNIRDLDLGEILDIDRTRDGTTLILDYEVREPLVYNADIVLTFNRRFDYPAVIE